VTEILESGAVLEAAETGSAGTGQSGALAIFENTGTGLKV
jgi:hypothetical protein